MTVWYFIGFHIFITSYVETF